MTALTRSAEKSFGAFGKVPQEIFDRTTGATSHLSIASLQKEFDERKTYIKSQDTQLKAARAWGAIFKDEKWLKAVMTSKSESHLCHPVLLGYDVWKIYNGDPGRVFLVLAIMENNRPCVKDCCTIRLYSRDGVPLICMMKRIGYIFPKRFNRIFTRDQDGREICLSWEVIRSD